MKLEKMVQSGKNRIKIQEKCLFIEMLRLQFCKLGDKIIDKTVYIVYNNCIPYPKRADLTLK